MYTIAICEDMDSDRKRLRKNLDIYFEERNMSYKLYNYWSGEEFLNYTQPYMYDIVIFDVEMGKINGIETAKRLRKIDKSVIIIFITVHANMVFSSFAAEPLNYLVKPLKYHQFRAIMDRATEKIEGVKNDFFVVSFNGIIYNIPMREIIYFESNKRLIKAVTVNGDYQFYGKLGDIERRLEEKGFIRCHQSFLVNSAFIQKVEKDNFYLVTEKTICISRPKSKMARKKFMSHIAGLKL